MPIISVIIPFYNREDALDRCLNSILRQTFKDFEVIIIDDGATDSSKSICKQYATNDNRITIINGEHNCVAFGKKYWYKKHFL